MSTKKRPSDKYASFVENGYRMTAYMPKSERERTAFRVEVTREADEKALFEYVLPMVYAPLFGVDMGDKGTLEGVTDRLLALLPDAAQYNGASLAVCQADANLQQHGVEITAV